IAEHWDEAGQRILIDGRVPINPHGGSLSEGATRGTGHLREAGTQLRGDAGGRQVPGARTALLTPGGVFFNSEGAGPRTAQGTRPSMAPWRPVALPPSSPRRATRYSLPTQPWRMKRPNRRRVPGAPLAAGSSLTRSSASFTPRPVSGLASPSAVMT